MARALDHIGTAMGVELRHAHRPWAGLRTFAADCSPVWGPAPDVDGFFWLASQGGYGINTSPALAQATAALLLSGGCRRRAQNSGCRGLSPGRFRAGR